MPSSGLISPTIDRGLHTVLVVDDNPATRYSTSRMLRAAGFQTIEVGTGSEALLAAHGPLSAVVLDVHLPDMDGIEVCRALRSNASTGLMPIVHLSAAFVESEHKVAGLNAGADAYMVHPVEPALLVATLQALIRARTAEDSQRRSESRFRAIYDRAPVAMMLIDATGCFMDANPAAEKLLQRSRQALIGTRISSLAPESWKEFVSKKAESTGTESWQGEFPLARADGKEIPLEWNMSNHFEPGMRIGIATDLSERIDFERRREELLEREQAARVLAERHSRTKDDFVAVLSHELRTPLTLITGWVHMLKRPHCDSQTLMRGIEAIERGTKAQSRIISDILDVSRIASGKLRLHRERADPAELARISLDALREQALAKKIELNLVHPGASTSAWLDITRFQQVVWNLVTNAIKFSNEGGTVDISLERTEDELVLTVRDHGIGIDPEFQPYVFERFTQTGTPGSRSHGGLGLGLSIVKHLVELHNGHVRAFSKGLGQGTAITATFLVSEHPVEEHGEDALSPFSESGRLLENKDILVVEDNADTSEMLSIVLTDEGARVRLAANFDEAIAELAKKWPDLYVSDIGLPGRDGYELIARMREMESAGGRDRVRAVALTAFSRPQDEARALQAGFDRHLGKPLQPHLLVQALL